MQSGRINLIRNISWENLRSGWFANISPSNQVIYSMTEDQWNLMTVPSILGIVQFESYWFHFPGKCQSRVHSYWQTSEKLKYNESNFQSVFQLSSLVFIFNMTFLLAAGLRATSFCKFPFIKYAKYDNNKLIFPDLVLLVHSWLQDAFCTRLMDDTVNRHGHHFFKMVNMSDIIYTRTDRSC